MGQEITPTAANPRAHRRVASREPVGGKRRPGVFYAIHAAISRGLEAHQGPLWTMVRRLRVVVAGYTKNKAGGRVRAFRTDAAESLAAMVAALVYLADVRSGFIGRPNDGGGRWHRYNLRDLAQLAYQGQGRAELGRAQRALQAMQSIGWLLPTKQVRTQEPDGSFRGHAAVRRLNLKKLCKDTGTLWMLARDRRDAEARYGSVNVTDLWDEKRKRDDRTPRGEREPTRRRVDSGPPPGGGQAVSDVIQGILTHLRG